MTKFVEHLFALPTWLGLAFVFLFPAAEAAVFLGFVIPGEIAVVLGGVLAYEGRVPLAAVLAAAISGAVVGDSIGFVVGRRYGRRVLDSTLGRFIDERHIERGETYLRAHGGKAVFLGRWTAALRALIPGLAGMSGMHYRQFLLWNLLGGALWATTFVLIGDIAGNGWRQISEAVNTAGLVVVGVLMTLTVVVVLVRRHRKKHPRTGTLTDSAAHEADEPGNQGC